VSVRLSFIIPAYNEARRIGPTLHDAETYLARQPFESEIIVVDDGSLDNTAQVVHDSFPGVKLIRYHPNCGKGHAVKVGMQQAVGDIRVFSDADGSTPIQELEKFWPCFDAGADIVIGSRSMPKSDIEVRQHFLRETMGRIFNLFVKSLVITGYIDTQCGFKGFTRHASGIVFPRQRLDGFSFDTELLFIAQKHGLRVMQVPIRWRNSARSRVSIFSDSPRMFRDLFRIRINDWLGYYK